MPGLEQADPKSLHPLWAYCGHTEMVPPRIESSGASSVVKTSPPPLNTVVAILLHISRHPGKTFPPTRRTRRLDAIPEPSSEVFRAGSTGYPTHIRNPLICIGLSHHATKIGEKSSEASSESGSGAIGQEKGLTNLELAGLYKRGIAN